MFVPIFTYCSDLHKYFHTNWTLLVINGKIKPQFCWNPSLFYPLLISLGTYCTLCTSLFANIFLSQLFFLSNPTGATCLWKMGNCCCFNGIKFAHLHVRLFGICCHSLFRLKIVEQNFLYNKMHSFDPLYVVHNWYYTRWIT